MCDSTSTGCFFSSSNSNSARKENGRSIPDVTASPGRAPPGPLPNQLQNMGQRQGQMLGQQQHHHQQQQSLKEPVLLQGDFRKVSGISSEIFRQIEAVENDHDSNTGAALEAVERKGDMIVRILEARNIGGQLAVEAAQKLITKSDARHTVHLVEIVKRPGQTLGLYIREGNGGDRTDGVFISRIALESAVYNSGCLRVGDEILAVNLVDVTHMSLDDVVIIMSIPRRLVLAIRQRRGSSSAGNRSYSPAGMYSRQEQKPPPVVVIKRDLRDEDLEESDRLPRSRSSRERRTGDGREMTESRSRLGLGLNNYSPQSEQLDLFYNSRPNVINEPPSWGYKPPPPPSVITEQPKGHHAFQPSQSYFQNAGTLESLAEKVHPFFPGGPSRRMSAGTGNSAGIAMSQSHSRFPRSGSDQHLPRVEYSDPTYASLGRHSLLRSTLKTGAPIATGGTLGRYGRYEPPRTSKYGTPPSVGGPGSLTRRSRPNLDYSSDTEATIGSARPSYYYYNRPALGTMSRTGHGATSVLGGGPDLAKFNSLPRDRPGVRLGFDRYLDDADGNLSAPESSARRERNLLRSRITASPSIFTSDEYRAWLRRAPSSSAICDQMRMSRDLLMQPRSHRFSCSAENIHDALKNTENIYSSRTGTLTGTMDRNIAALGIPRGISSLPVRSMSSQHIGTAASIRSPSIRRMRQLLELSTGPGPGSPSGSIMSAGHQSPAPTPSATLPRSHRQIDINPAEFVKYKLDKPVMDVGGVSGMLWIHLLAGRGLRTQPDILPSNSSVALQQQQQQQQQQSRDLYCVLECDRVHKARTVVRSGDLQFDWDESFELDLVCNKQLDVLVYSWDPQHRHKLCYRGAISLASLLRQSPLHQLALKVEPRGTIYIRLRHTDPITLYKRRGLPSLRAGYPQLFGADLETVVNRESKGAPGSAPVPIVLRRCVEEVERRGLDIIGLYRLCGSATKKRLLREAFERNSRAVELSPEHVPDINVITGVLKDYLRELPEPLFTRCLFQMTVDALAVCLPDDPEGNAKLMLSILDCLPRANRATLVFLLDHLSLVVSASERNKMSAQALATVMGPPLMLHSSNAAPGADIDHAQPIAVLKYLLQIWPQPHSAATAGSVSGRRGEPTGQRGNKVNALQADKQHQSLVNLPTAAALVGTVGRSQGQLHLTASILPYQSAVVQLAQSPRVLQQVGQQRPLSVVSADSVTHAQSPLPGTPSPGSSSTSTGSGSSDTVKRGASPASVKHLKINETSIPLSTNIDKQIATSEMQQNDFTKTSSSTNLQFIKSKESNNDKSRSSNSYGPIHPSSYSDQTKYSTSTGSIVLSSVTKQSSKSVHPSSSTPSSRYRRSIPDDSDSDTGSTRSKTPNPLIEQSQQMTTTQLMSKYLKRDPVVSMTLVDSPSPPVIQSLSSSIRDLTMASQSAAIGGINPIDSPNRFEQKFSTSFSKQLSAASISSISTTTDPSLINNNINNKLSSSQTLGSYSSNSLYKSAGDFEMKLRRNGSSNGSSSGSPASPASSIFNKVSSPSRQIINTTSGGSNLGRNLTLSTTTSDSEVLLNLIDEKQFNFNNYPVSPDPFNTSHIKFDTNGSSASSTLRNGNNGANHFYNIYGTLPKSTNIIQQQSMVSSTSSYLSSGSGGDTTTTSGISSMAGSTSSSYDFYGTNRHYDTGGTSSNSSSSNIISGGNYHTLGSYRVQYTATNPFLDIFEPSNGSSGRSNGSKSSSLNLGSLKDNYDEFHDLK